MNHKRVQLVRTEIHCHMREKKNLTFSLIGNFNGHTLDGILILKKNKLKAATIKEHRPLKLPAVFLYLRKTVC